MFILSDKMNMSRPLRRRHRQPRARVVRAGPGELLLVALAVEVRHHRRVQVALALRRRIQKAAALRRAQPLVAVADVPSHALIRQRIQRQRQHARRVSAVHQHRHAARAAQAHDLLDGRHRRQRREDMVDDRQARTAGKRFSVRRHHRLRPRQRPGHARLHQSQSVAIGDEARRVLHARIGVVGDDDALPRAPAQRAQHRVGAGRGVLHKSQSLRHGADEAGQPHPRRQQRRRQLIHHEAHRLALHRLAPARLRREHMQGRRAEGTVVEETDARVERPQAAQGVAEGGSR